ncbi:MAG: hypothetical protein ACRD2T_00905 [Thermoanaerobaculia bacterium]
MSAPAVAASMDGKQLAAIWMDKREGKRDLNVYWSLAAPRFEKDAAAHAETRGIQNHPTLAMDPGGAIWAAWEDDRSGEPRIRARSLPEGAEIEVSGPSEGPAGFPVVAARDGLVAVVYEALKEDPPAAVFRLLQSPRGER